MKQSFLILIYFLFLVMAIATGCQQDASQTKKAESDSHAGHEHNGHDDHAGHDDHGGHDHDGHADGESVVVETIWQDGLEMFGEWPPFEAGHSSRAVLHFTSLESFQPATEGPLTISWLTGDEIVKSQVVESVTRAGIFIVDIAPPAAGTYRLTMSLASPQMSGTITLPLVRVFADHAPPIALSGHGEEEISFLKEQQWILGTKIEKVERRDIHDNVRAPGELKPAGNKTSEVYASFAGVLLPDPTNGAVRHGQTVRKGQALAMISPSPNAENSWYELQGEYRLAKAELARVERLFDESAVSKRRLEEARQLLTVKRAQLNAALGGAELEEEDGEVPYFTIRSPRDGVIADHDAAYGAYVHSGQKLFSVVDPDIVWLDVQVAAADVRNERNIRSAYFQLNGTEQIYSTDQFDGKVIASGTVLDPQTRRIPVTFELNNSDGVLRVGEFVQVDLQTSASRNAVVVPKTSIVEDGGAPVAYVQTGGESFERRIVVTGATDGPWVEILSGVKVGERVVTAGAYKIKLATSSTGEIGHGHAH